MKMFGFFRWMTLWLIVVLSAVEGGNGCGGNVYEDSGVLQIPQNSSLFPIHRLNCWWHVQVSSDKVVNVTFTKFDVNAECRWCDRYFDVRDSNYQRIYGNVLRGSTVPRSFVSTSNLVRFNYYFYRYYSGYIRDSSIVEMHWQAIDPPNKTEEVVTDFNCGSVVSNISKNIYSPGYPNNYPAKKDCLWNISANQNEFVSIVFVQFIVEYHHRCIWDYLDITSSQDTLKFCGRNHRRTTLAMKGPVTIHFHSDEIVNTTGFHLFYELRDHSFEPCGNASGVTLSGDSGSFSSVGGLHPSGHYTCRWTINVDPGRVIQVNFTQFYLPCYGNQRLYIEEGYGAAIGELNCAHDPPKPFISTNNSIKFIYERFGYGSDYKPLFNVSWEAIDDPTMNTSTGFCFNYLNQFRGFTSPGYPDKYLSNVDTCWVINVPSEQHNVLLWFFGLKTEQAFQCMNDYVLISDKYGTRRYCGSYSARLQLYGNVTITFRTDSTIEYDAFAVAYIFTDHRWVATDRTCGASGLLNSSGFISSPGFPTNYQRNDFCEWNFTAPAGKVIEFHIIHMNMRTNSYPCSHDYIEISDGNETVPMRICGHPGRILISKSNSPKLTFNARRNWWYSYGGEGFAFYYRTKNATQSSDFNCSLALTNRSGNIYSPGYGNNYPNNADCVWNISANQSEFVSIVFVRFILENYYDCIWDYLDITSNQETMKFCRSQYRKTLAVKGPVTIRFHSDEVVNTTGFHLFYELRDHSFEPCGNASGVTLSGGSGSFSSVGGLHRSGRYTCRWTINVDPGRVIQVNFTQFYVPCYGNQRLYIEEGYGAAIGELNCAHDPPKPFISTNNSIKFIYEHFGYGSDYKPLFNVSWEAIDDPTMNTSTGFCFNYLNQFRGFTSPGYPDKYLSNVDTCWVINVPSEQHNVLLWFFGLKTEQAFQCMNDYVLISDKYGTRRYCGSYSARLQLYGNVTITFRTDSTIEYDAFAVAYTFTDHRWVATDRTCGASGLLNSSGFISSPGFPTNYQRNDFCEWNFTAPAGKVIEFHIIHMNMRTNSYPCSHDYIEISDGNETVPMRICGHPGRILISKSNSPKLTFNARRNWWYSYGGEGFAFYYRTKNATQSSDFNCSLALTNRSGNIYSPGYGNNYPNNADCVWNISANQNEFVSIVFVRFILENYYDCIWDYLDITSNQETMKFCRSQYRTTLAVKGPVTIRFHSDEVVNKTGFHLFYELRDHSFEPCGNASGVTLSGGSGSFSSVGGLHPSGHYTCRWTINVDPGRVIQVNFTEFYVPCYGNRLHIEEENGRAIGELSCLYDIPKSFISTTNNIKFTYEHYGNGYVYKPLFNVSWEAIDNPAENVSSGSCFNYLNSSRGFTSPGYPVKYFSNVDTCWVINVPSEQHRVIMWLFSRNIERAFGCMNDYILLSHNYNTWKICSGYIGSFQLYGNVTITFRTDSTIQYDGFAVVYAITESNWVTSDKTCGASELFNSTGIITSPGFPNRYQRDDVCEWSIVAPKGKVIEFHFLRMNMWNRYPCLTDYIEITDGNKTSPKRICSDPRETLTTNSNLLHLTFNAINGGGREGFALYYRTINATQSSESCGGYLNSTNYLQSPRFSNNYPHNLNCYWTIPVEQCEIITIRFHHFNIEFSEKCTNDVLEIYGKHRADSHKFCGSSRPGDVRYADDDVTVHFVSDFALASYGFSMRWYKTKITPCVTTTTTTTQQTTTPLPISKAVQIQAYSGRNMIFLIFEKQDQLNQNVTLAYDVTINGENFTKKVIIGSVTKYFITDLDLNVTYAMVIEVYDNYRHLGTVNLNASTNANCTKSCTNSVCLFMGPELSSCYCYTGYQKHENGSDVCHDINECDGVTAPCPNNSKCSNTDGSYACVCNQGYQRVEGRCEDFSICSLNPCANNGICVPLNNQFSCRCPPYYQGSRCEQYINPCLYAPCKHGGKCTDAIGNYSCECTSAYTGHSCTEDVDECETGNYSCLENSHCQNTYGGYDCTCNDGFRGDGKENCYKVVLLPYGPDANDETVAVGDNKISSAIKVPFGLQIGEKTFTVLNVASNGFITLGPLNWYHRYLNRPAGKGFGSKKIPMIAPFWDDFHPSEDNKGRVYYQVYDKIHHSLSNESAAVVEEVSRRIRRFANLTDFDSKFVLKATWSKVVMYYERFNREYPSTFQAIIATDLSSTYVIYNYMEDGMLFDKKKRLDGGNRALIGFTNGDDLEFVEVQGEYRPDKRSQSAGGEKGQYYYHVAQGFSHAQIAKARASCFTWYVKERKSDWSASSEPCPCTQLQVRVDRRFTTSVDQILKRFQRYEDTHPGRYRSGDVSEWAHDAAKEGNCYQFRVYAPNMPTPRCCYGSGKSVFSRWIGWWQWGPLLKGEFGSRYERYQIPIIERNPGWNWVFQRNINLFNKQYKLALVNDLIPRRHCCVESKSVKHCNYYREMRPAATCDGYVRREPAFFFGDPHITTSDGVLYSFNGLGEYHMVYAPGVFALQARTQKAEKDDGTTSDATVFVAFAAKDLASSDSGTVQFEVDVNNTSGNGVIVKVDGVSISTLSQEETTVQEVSLALMNGTFQAVFPSSQSLSISASNFLLSLQFTGDTGTMQNISKGLFGFWDGNKENDFEMRDATVVDWSSLQPTENLDILNGTLSERKLFPFGQSWKVRKSESIFNYSGGSDTYEQHNPSSAPEPPFLEDLVARQRNTSLFKDILSNCTTNGVISTTCLYDVLTTNRSDIGKSTLADTDSSVSLFTANDNSPPNITLEMNENTDDDKTLRAKIDVRSTFTFSATDPDGNDVTFSLESDNAVPGMIIDSGTGVVTWTPTAQNIITSDTNRTLTVIATDALGAESVLSVNIKLCACENDGTCLYDENFVGNENYEIVRCECGEAYDGDYCTDDRNGCELAACFTGVTCTDVQAPGVGENCGECPTGMEGNGRNCTNINLCESNPCEQNCEPLYNDYNCSCNDGYTLIDSTRCADDDECSTGNPCVELSNSMCVNNDGGYSCDCLGGFVNNESLCIDIDECSAGNHNCSMESSTCFNTPGSFSCLCLSNYTRADGMSEQSACVDRDECAERLHSCNNETQVCVNKEPFYRCDCKTGFHELDETCQDIKECQDPSHHACDTETSLCVEQQGGYDCSCLPGYEEVDEICTKINDEGNLDPCSGNSTCKDEPKLSYDFRAIFVTTGGISSSTKNQKLEITRIITEIKGNSGLFYSGLNVLVENARSIESRTEYIVLITIRSTNTTADEFSSLLGGHMTQSKIGGGSVSSISDFNECGENYGNCSTKATCTNSNGGYTCACPKELYDASDAETPSGTRCDNPVSFTCYSSRVELRMIGAYFKNILSRMSDVTLGSCHGAEQGSDWVFNGSCDGVTSRSSDKQTIYVKWNLTNKDPKASIIIGNYINYPIACTFPATQSATFKFVAKASDINGNETEKTIVDDISLEVEAFTDANLTMPLISDVKTNEKIYFRLSTSSVLPSSIKMVLEMFKTTAADDQSLSLSLISDACPVEATSNNALVMETLGLKNNGASQTITVSIGAHFQKRSNKSVAFFTVSLCSDDGTGSCTRKCSLGRKKRSTDSLGERLSRDVEIPTAQTNFAFHRAEDDVCQRDCSDGVCVLDAIETQHCVCYDETYKREDGTCALTSEPRPTKSDIPDSHDETTMILIIVAVFLVVLTVAIVTVVALKKLAGNQYGYRVNHAGRHAVEKMDRDYLVSSHGQYLD